MKIKTILPMLLMTVFPFALAAQSVEAKKQVDTEFCEAFTALVASYPTFDAVKGEKVESDFSAYFVSNTEVPGFIDNRISIGLFNTFSYTGIAAKNLKTQTAALKVFGDLKEKISSCSYGFGTLLHHDDKDTMNSAHYTPFLPKDEKYKDMHISVRILFDELNENYRVVLNVKKL